MEYQEMMKLINWPRKGPKSLLIKLFGIPFAVGKEVKLSHLRPEHLNKWKTCAGCYQPKMLMSEHVQRRAKELQAMLRSQLRVAVGLLTGHTTLRAHMFRLGLTQWKDCQLCIYGKEDSVRIVCLALACKRYTT